MVDSLVVPLLVAATAYGSSGLALGHGSLGLAHFRVTMSSVILALSCGLVWDLLSKLPRFGDRDNTGFWTLAGRAARVSAMTALFACLCLAATHSGVGLFWLAIRLFVCLFAYACVSRYLAVWSVSRTASNRGSALILGSGRRAQKAWRELRISHHGSVEFLGFMDDCTMETVAPDISGRYLGALSELPQYLLRNSVDFMIVATSLRTSFETTRTAVSVAESFGVRVLYMRDPLELGHRTPAGKDERMFDEPELARNAHPVRLAVKYGLDKAIALTVLLALAPVLLLISLMSWWIMRGTVLVSQLRYGRHRRAFHALSFNTGGYGASVADGARSAGVDGSPSTSSVQTGPVAQRFAYFLRATYLDRLPRLWNVLVGDMSLVGPEPMITPVLSPIFDDASSQTFRARPGLFRPSKLMERGARDGIQILKVDATYLNSWSLAVDAKLVVETLWRRCFGTALMSSTPRKRREEWADTVPSTSEVSK